MKKKGLKNALKGILLIANLIVLSPEISKAQSNVGIGTKTPSADAVLDLVSKNKGFLAPRVTTAERLAIAAVSNGLLVYDTNLSLFFYWQSSTTSWQPLDDNSAVNELIQGVTYDSITNILKIWDAGSTYNVNLKKFYNGPKIRISNDTIYLTNGGFVKLPASTDNQTLSRNGGRISIQRGNTILIPDSSSTNELHWYISWIP